MSIQFEKDGKIAHLYNDTMSFILEVVDGTYVTQRYFGRRIRKYHETNAFQYFKRGFVTKHDSIIEHMAFDDFPFAYPNRGSGDYRIPALTISQENGIKHHQFTFKQWRMMDEKPSVQGLPSTFFQAHEASSLEVICEDAIAHVRLYLYYTIVDDNGIILCHQKLENYGETRITIQNMRSASLELPAQTYDFLSLYGTHIHEANQNRFPLHQGIQKIESVRGVSSSQHQPFFALMSPNTNETTGEIYAFHFIYSGNFIGEVEKDQFGNVRAQLGLHPDTFSWQLHPHETFESPEVVINYAAHGLNEMSQNFHSLYKKHLMPQRFMDMERPILLNSWESMYYDITMEKVEKQIFLAQKAGIELFVLDDGWMRWGNSSLTGLGDWICNEHKLPKGIAHVADIVHHHGMKFGLWFEPEMMSAQSHLYETHPEWALQVPGYPTTIGRGSYVLDVSQKEIQDYIIAIFDTYLQDGKIEYIKWDMNRPLCEANSLFLDASQKGELMHRYILGLYHILDVVTKKYPHVLIEGCCSGGSRFDPGMLYYTPQIWTSDNTDAHDRVQIQSGYSLLYPPVAMGAHVSVVPNHQTGRITSLQTRYDVARFANFGYELDLSACTKEELQSIALQIEEIKQHRTLLQTGDFFRHDTPNDNYVMWSIVNKEKTEAFVLIYQKMHNPEYSHGVFKINGLHPDYDYINIDTKEIYGGDELMYTGLSIPSGKEDFTTFHYHFQCINK